MDDKTALAYAIARAIALAENGGTIPSKGKKGATGELASVYQFMPKTWAGYAKDILGNAKAPLTPENETKVVVAKVQQWIDKGYNSKQIASMWNAGEGRPNAYAQNWRGTNKGVKYDTPAYANKVAQYARDAYTNHFGPQIQTPQSITTANTTPQKIIPPVQSTTNTVQGSNGLPIKITDVPTKNPPNGGLIGSLLNGMAGRNI